MKKVAYVGAVALTVMLTAGAVREADIVGAPTETSSLTIYNSNMALVRREVSRVLPAGMHTVRVEGLPTNTDPSSLIVLNEGVTLLGARGFRSYQDAAAGPGASLDLDLDVEIQTERLQLAYLTTGLNWSASYSVIVARDDATAQVDGYATLVNGSGTGYEGAEVLLLAGTIQRGGRAEYADEFRMARAYEAAAEAPALQEAAFGDYHLYTVSTPLSLRAGESRRIRLVGARSVKTQKVYTFANTLTYHRQQPEPVTRPVAVSYRVKRPEDSEFGDVPLPGGQVRVLQRDEDGRIQLLGVAGLANTPKRQDLSLHTGYAFEIVGTRIQTDFERPGGNVYESAWKVELKNESESDARVQVIEQLTGDWEIIESSHSQEKLSAGAVRFNIDVPSRGTTVLEYRVSVRS
jgi:hypothetical protein